MNNLTHLNQLNLLTHCRQLIFLEPVELVETAPRTALNQPGENPSHGLKIDSLVAVEHQDLPAQRGAQRFDALRFAGPCRAVRIASLLPARLSQDRWRGAKNSARPGWCRGWAA